MSSPFEAPSKDETPSPEPRWRRWLEWLVAALIAALGMVALFQPVPQVHDGQATGTRK